MEIRTGTPVIGIDIEAGRVTAVHTDTDRITTDVIAVAAGMWTPQVASMVGVTVPIQALEHQSYGCAPARRCPRTCRRCATRTTSCTSGRPTAI